jgi:redox-sensing transcriptional repressor
MLFTQEWRKRVKRKRLEKDLPEKYFFKKNSKIGNTGYDSETEEMLFKLKNLERPISSAVIKRLSKYLLALEFFNNQDRHFVSSLEIAEAVACASHQIRKDLSFFGGFGNPGKGYNVKILIKVIEKILGLKQGCICMALAGVGNLGTALLNYKGFKAKGFNIVAAFDHASSKQTGKLINNVYVHDIASASEVIKDMNISIVLLAVPACAAQHTADIFIKAEVKGFLNFAPYIISVPENVYVKHADMALELETINFYLNNS